MNNKSAVVKPRHKAMLVVAAVVGSIAQAHAALPQAVTDAFTAVSSDVADMGDLAWPLAVAVTLISIGIGLFKKFVSKAAS
jgi:hypothetical protein